MADEEIRLSAEQQRAVDSSSRAIVVLASAGSGKTETIARRVLRLLEESSSEENILALSYTNKAADELRNRLRERAGSLAKRVVTETIHGFAHSLIRQHGTRIGLSLEPELLTRDEDRAELLNRWRASEGIRPLQDPRKLLQDIDISRATLQESEQVDQWRMALASLPGLDFPALLDAAIQLAEIKGVRRQIARSYSNIIVDEAQNLTPVQFKFLSLLGEASNSENSIMLVGDDKQSIVSFAGADPALMGQFALEQNAETIRLSGNFRSAMLLDQLGARIAAEMDGSAQGNTEHAARGEIQIREVSDEEAEGQAVVSWVQRLLTEGMPEHAIAEGESRKIYPKEIAILGRSVAALRTTRETLDSAGVPVEMISSSADWLEGPAGKILMELVSIKGSPDHVSTRWRLARLLNVSEEDLVSEEQIQNAISKADAVYLRSLHKLIDCPTLEDAITYFLETEGPEDAETTSAKASWESDLREISLAWDEFRSSYDQNQRSWINFSQFSMRRQTTFLQEGVQLMTIHKAQGREYKAVVVVGMNNGQIPDFRARSQQSLMAELRTFYVAVTRARRLLLLTRAESRATRFGPRSADPSPYLRFVRAD